MTNDSEIAELFSEYNKVNGIPDEFIPAVERMYKYVSAVD